LLGHIFHDAEDIEPSVEERIEEMQKDWRAIFVHAAENEIKRQRKDQRKSLSMIYVEKSMKEVALGKKRKRVIEGHVNFVFDPREAVEGQGSVDEGFDSELGSYPHERSPHFVDQLFVWFRVLFQPDSTQNRFPQNQPTIGVRRGVSKGVGDSRRPPTLQAGPPGNGHKAIPRVVRPQGVKRFARRA
jgi:hypothetical protein